MSLPLDVKHKCKKILQFKWFHRLHILYIFGFVSNFRPSSPFFYEFLIKENSHENTIHNIVPTFFYSTTVALLPTFLLMETLKFNPFIIISSLAGLTATCLYIWGAYITEMQIAQTFSGCATAAEVAYFISIYSHVEVKQFQLVTSYVRAAPLLAKCLAGFLAQLLVYLNWLTYLDLFYFNLAGFIIGTVFTVFLPVVPEREKEQVVNFLPNKFVLKWSIWGVLTLCGYNLTINYVQPLLKHVQEKEEQMCYNGLLEGVFNLFGVVGTILGGYATFNWKFNGDLILSMTSLVQGFLLVLMSQITTVILNSTFYVLFSFMYNFIITILFTEIAKFLQNGFYGYTFGLLNFFSWLVSSLIVAFVINQFPLEIDDFTMVFMSFGFYHLGISVLFIVIGLAYWFAKHTYE